MKERKGITIIALIITIIIILILATVTINMAFGENGLINQAQLAKDLTENSIESDAQSMLNLASYMNEILVEENKVTQSFPTDGSYSMEKGINTPKIGNNMELVVFDTKTNTWIKDERNSGYNYIDTSRDGNENKSEWANARVDYKWNRELFCVDTKICL